MYGFVPAVFADYVEAASERPVRSDIYVHQPIARGLNRVYIQRRRSGHSQNNQISVIFRQFFRNFNGPSPLWHVKGVNLARGVVTTVNNISIIYDSKNCPITAVFISDRTAKLLTKKRY